MEFYRKLEEEENRKKEAEEKAARDAEAEKYFHELDTNKDGAVAMDELQAGLD